MTLVTVVLITTVIVGFAGGAFVTVVLMMTVVMMTMRAVIIGLIHHLDRPRLMRLARVVMVRTASQHCV